jgi:hypothetical protein
MPCHMDRVGGLILLQRSIVCSWKIENKLDMDLKHVLHKYEAGINDCLTRERLEVVSFYPNTRRSNYYLSYVSV